MPPLPPLPPFPPVGLELIWSGGASGPPPQGGQPLLAGFVNGQPGGPLPVCRAAHQGGVHPGKFWQGRCYIGWGGQEVAVERFDVLFFRPAPNQGQLAWVNADGRTPPNAVIGGQESGRQLGVCRVPQPNGWHPGKLIDGRCSIGFGGREVVLAQYQALTQARPGEAWLAQPPAAGTPAQAQADTCGKISGTYGPQANAALILGPDGRTLFGQMMNGKRPNFYGTCVNGLVDVRISDDPNPAAGRGTFDGKTVKWGNNTTWVKND